MRAVFSRNGAILPNEEATISVFNIEYSYGFGVYETVRVTKGVPFFIDEHINRLLSSAQIIELDHPYNASQIQQYVDDLTDALGAETFNLKMLLIGASEAQDALLLLLPLAPLFPDRKLYRDGAHMTAVEYTRFLPHAKTLNMLPSYLAYRTAKRRGCYDALLVDTEQNILEGTRTNFFAISGKMLYSPPKEKILEGITRQAVIQVARAEGYEVVEQTLPLGTIDGFDSAFLTSTSSKIIPIQRIDDVLLSPASAELRQLMKAFDAFLGACQGRLSI